MNKKKTAFINILMFSVDYKIELSFEIVETIP